MKMHACFDIFIYSIYIEFLWCYVQRHLKFKIPELTMVLKSS